MLLRVSYLLFWLFFFGANASATALPQAVELTPPLGLWEGINRDYTSYQLLEINPKPPHRLISLSIANGFKHAVTYNFGDDDIACSTSECTIDTVHPQRPDEHVRLVMTPYLKNGLTVLEISRDAAGSPIYSSSYRLEQQKDQSTVRRFLQQHLSQLQSLKPAPKEDISGFWLGILTMSYEDKPELLKIELHRDQTSTFTRYINGENYTNETTFEPKQMVPKEAGYFIQTTHPHFANQLVIHRIQSDTLSGYMYSIQNGQLQQTGSFRLTRLGL